jgi:hypothetical protein
MGRHGPESGDTAAIFETAPFTTRFERLRLTLTL